VDGRAGEPLAAAARALRRTEAQVEDTCRREGRAGAVALPTLRREARLLAPCRQGARPGSNTSRRHDLAPPRRGERRGEPRKATLADAVIRRRRGYNGRRLIAVPR
jgi:hypothetical protein